VLKVPAVAAHEFHCSTNSAADDLGGVAWRYFLSATVACFTALIWHASIVVFSDVKQQTCHDAALAMVVLIFCGFFAYCA